MASVGLYANLRYMTSSCTDSFLRLVTAAVTQLFGLLQQSLRQIARLWRAWLQRLFLLLSLLLPTFFLTCAAPAHAHQMKSAISKVLFNSRTGNLEVMHRFYLHDAEHAVKHLQHKKADLLNDAASRQQFAEYVAQHFQLSVIESASPRNTTADITTEAPATNRQHRVTLAKPLKLSLLGTELDGRFIWVYQETPLPVQLPLQHELQLEVQHDSLMELWPSQVNAVNFEGARLHNSAGKVRTLKLTRQQSIQRLTLYSITSDGTGKS